jgi:hypothetical protein
MKIVPGATHLFEEPGTLDEVALLAAEWFRRHLQPQQRSPTVGDYCLREERSEFYGDSKTKGSCTQEYQEGTEGMEEHVFESTFQSTA